MRKSPFLGLRTCIYHVSDLNEAKAWYAKAFGVDPYFDEPFYVGFNIGGFELGLLPEEEPTTEKPSSVSTYWGVEDIHQVYTHLLACGATEAEAPNSVGGELMVASVRDPWRNLLGIIYNPVFQIESD
ncbi:MAG: VOC family protein [Bacteroidota bacterium]